MTYLEFVFRDWAHFFGCLAILYVGACAAVATTGALLGGLADMLAAMRGQREGR